MRVTLFTRDGLAAFAMAAMLAVGVTAPASASALRRSDGPGGSGAATPSSGSSGASTPASGSTSSSSGGAGLGPFSPVTGSSEAPSTPQHPTVPGFTARIIDGVAYAPSLAPLAVKRAIWAGNQIRLKPYILGGGHGSFTAAGYDCSGSVSYVLHAAGLLKTPMDSSDLLGWGRSGLGQWITVYTNPAHAFVEIAGIRLDTSSEGDPRAASGSGPRWRPLLSDTAGFVARHPSRF